jgi:peroxiredoxin
VKKYKDSPFVVVGVNSDDRETLESAIQREEFPFRWLSDGSTAGPISLDWNVELWPTLYVLDKEGTIHFKQTGASDTDSLDQAIDELLHGQGAADNI